MKQIKTQIDINAPIKTVWNQLIQLNNYKAWNPFIIDAKGTIESGNTLEINVQLDSGVQTFKPKVISCQDEQEFIWKGNLGSKHIFSGEHYFKLERISESETRLHHGEHFSGLLSGLIFSKIEQPTKAGFIEMNKALKKTIELNNN